MTPETPQKINDKATHTVANLIEMAEPADKATASLEILADAQANVQTLNLSMDMTLRAIFAEEFKKTLKRK